MLDLKLHDIPTTVARAAAALHKQHEFNLLTAHCGDSPNALIKLAEHIDVNKIVGITVLTSVDWNGIHNYHGANFNLDELIVRRVMSAHVNAGVNKFVCSGRDLPKLRKSLDESSPYPGVKFITPGVRSLKPTDDQARVTTPTRAIKNGSWLLVIGREIRDAENPINAAAKIHNDVMEAMSDE
jgi:orotidine-5'-phosphate decarboxylase